MSFPDNSTDFWGLELAYPGFAFEKHLWISSGGASVIRTLNACDDLGTQAYTIQLYRHTGRMHTYLSYDKGYAGLYAECYQTLKEARKPRDIHPVYVNLHRYLGRYLATLRSVKFAMQSS